MKIGELAKRSGLPASRIRFYEASGLLQGVERRDNGYRAYGPGALLTLEIITSAQAGGFSLEEIRGLLPDADQRWEHAGLLDNLQRKLAEIEALQQRLEHNKARLLVAIDSVRNRSAELACSDQVEAVMNKLRVKPG